MFIGREIRLIRAVRGCSELFLEHLWLLSDSERAGALLIATATLGVLGIERGNDFINDPASRSPRELGQTVGQLSQAIENLAPLLARADAEELPHIMRQIVALEFVTICLGYPLDQTVRPVLREGWRRLRGASPYLQEGLAALRQYEREAGVPALPEVNGKPLTDKQLLTAARFVPKHLATAADMQEKRYAD